MYSLQSLFFFFFSSRRRHTRSLRDWSSDVCSSDLVANHELTGAAAVAGVIAGGRVLRMDLPAELPRARHDERAGGAVDFAAVRINERLQEARPQRPETIEIPVERRGGCLRRRDTHQCHSTGT